MSSKLWGLLKLRKPSLRVADDEGVVRLQKGAGELLEFAKSEMDSRFLSFIEANTRFSDAGATLPKTYLYFGQKSADLSGVTNKEQLLSLAKMECETLPEDARIIAVAAHE